VAAVVAHLGADVVLNLVLPVVTSFSTGV